MDRCTACVLPVASQGITFDAEGVCSVCRAVQARPAPDRRAGAEASLAAQIAAVRARGKGRPFDCVVGLSGGRDSTHLLHRLVERHGLRCLAAYYRTPFTPDAIDANVRRLVARLGVTLEEIAISREYHRRIAAEIVALWAQRPDPILANLACAPCKRVNSELLAIARRHRVRTVVLGSNRFEIVQVAAGSRRAVAPTTAAAAREQSRLPAQLAKMAVVVRRGMATLVGHRRTLWRYLPLALHASLLALTPDTPYLRLRHPRIRVLEYFSYAQWSEREVERSLAEVGWELPPGCRSSWRADCTFADLKNTMFQRCAGLTYTDALLSNMVRAGALSRQAALARLGAGVGLSAERVEETVAALRLPPGVAASLVQLARADEPDRRFAS